VSEHSAEAVLHYWFNTLRPKLWFSKDSAVDEDIHRRFGGLLARAAACELWHWRDNPNGRLAEVIVLDQFSRNIFRDQPGAFANDALALALAQEAVRQGEDQRLPAGPRRAFLYMPYMHSESLTVHEQAVRLFDQPELQHNLEFEHRHKAIIERFGRYPHRNAILGRCSSAEEREFLQQPGSSF
jgi:uncharacterized protein (DUF924 family)